jgi:putative transposase
MFAFGALPPKSGPTEVRARVDNVALMLEDEFPAVAQLLLEANAGLTALTHFPPLHWRKIWSTDPL